MLWGPWPLISRSPRLEGAHNPGQGGYGAGPTDSQLLAFLVGAGPSWASSHCRDAWPIKSRTGGRKLLWEEASDCLGHSPKQGVPLPGVTLVRQDEGRKVYERMPSDTGRLPACLRPGVWVGMCPPHPRQMKTSLTPGASAAGRGEGETHEHSALL